MTILFASDLDQTLIYSERSMGSGGEPGELVEVERFEGKPQSFMTEQSQSALWSLDKNIVFVPVTTRTRVQYERVTGIYQGNDTPEFAIVSNGAVILKNGEPIEEWSSKIREQCVSRKTVIEELMPLVQQHFNEEWVLRVRQAEDWFVYLIVDRDNFPEEKLAFYKQTFREFGWSMSLQGRKLYLMPESITKAVAMEYVRNRLKADYVIAAGDSLLDMGLLESADAGLLASHGEAVKAHTDISEHITVTKEEGIKAGEEILAKVAEISMQSSK